MEIKSKEKSFGEDFGSTVNYIHTKMDIPKIKVKLKRPVL